MRDLPPERRLGEIFEDLEQQAEGLELAERDTEVAELGTAEYSSVDLLSRLHGSVGRSLVVRLPHGMRVRGLLTRVGQDFCILEDDHAIWLVRPCSCLALDGLSRRAVIEAARTILSRLTLRSVLRRLAAEGTGCTVHLVDGDRLEGNAGRVGADFFELNGPGAGDAAVPFAAVAAVRVRR